MKNVLNSEIYKAVNRKSIRISGLICMIIGIIMGIIIVIYGDRIGADLSGVNYIQETIVPNFSFLMIFAYIIPAMLITSEFKDNTMKNPLFVGTSRVKLLIAKFIVMFMVMMYLILIISIPPFLIVLFSNGWGQSFAVAQVGTIFLSIFKLWIYLCAYCSIFALMGVVIRNVIGSIALAYTFNIIEGALMMLSNAMKKFAWVEKLLLTSKNKIIMVVDIPTRELLGLTVFLCGFIIVTGALSVIHFKSQEIKS